jgi:hypothetical protein
MKTGDLLLLIGLGIGAVAGVLLAYDGLHGAGAQFKAEVAVNQLRLFKSHREWMQQSIRSLGGSYTDEEKKALLAQEEEDNKQKEAELSERASTIDSRYRDKVVIITMNGLYLLIGAFLIQLVGTLMDSLGFGGHL